VTETPRRAIGYLRVSTDLQAERGLGLEVQHDSVTAYAAVRGLDLIDVVEEAASGGVRAGEEFSYEHRPVLLALMERAEEGEFDVLIIAKLDRLSRDYATLVVLERRLERHGVQVLSAAEEQENGDGPIAELLRGQLALIAQFERAQIRERLSAGKAKKRSKGGRAEGRVPYGFRSHDAKLELHEPEARVVRGIYRDFQDGRRVSRIARILNRAGVPSPDRRRWCRQTVRAILENPVYSGTQHGICRAHPAIVSRRRFNEVQLFLAERRQTDSVYIAAQATRQTNLEARAASLEEGAV
jgi:site-specific DNA recombinase